MPTRLVPGASLGSLRGQARRLQRGVRSADPEALALLARHGVPGQPTHGQFPLTAAQLVVARTYGFPSWPRLQEYFAAAGPHRSDPSVHPGPHDSVADRLCRLACLTWTAEDGPDHRDRARRLLVEHPGLVGGSVWAAAAAADPDAVRTHVDRDPALAGVRGGPHGWAPLVYLTCSRVEASWERVHATARLLLDAGADPDAGFLWQGLVPPFTALTGAFGEGEQGPVRQPRHPHAPALARLLLEAGADPNDGQALYNRMFRPDDDHLVLLFEYGLGRGDGGHWRQVLGDVVATPAELLRGQVVWAVARGYADRVRLLASHGADIVTPLPGGGTLVEEAAARSDRTVVDALVSGGARAPVMDEVDALLAAAVSGDVAGVESLTSAHPGLAERARQRRPQVVLDIRAPSAVAVVARLGFDLDGAPAGRTALHDAALADDLPLVRALVEAGADRGVRDAEHRGTPLDWARHAHAQWVTGYLSSLPTDQD